MKQVTQRLRDGRIDVIDVPPPALTPETILVDVRASVLSAGTERSRTAAAQKGLVGKARARPEEARRVVQKLRQDGLQETVAAVRLRLDQPTAIGYSSAGVVVAVGDRVRGFAVGDRVACGGDGAAHAELDLVPENLAVRLPDDVSFDHGAFATLGAIALHGVRQADARLGERVAVIGLGLVGQLAAQILKASGCTVVGIDLDEGLVALAQRLGAVDAGRARSQISADVPDKLGGCDAVVITAATPSSDPIELAAQLCRDRGRVVVVGDVGIDVPRAPYYEKELDLRLSRSYGPGRYDREYEERGLDYPIGYVRWTERRNMEAFVDLVASGSVVLEPLIGRRVPVAEAASAYEGLVDGSHSPLGIVLQYDATPPVLAAERPAEAKSTADPLAAGVIGAGSFAQRTLIPALREAGFGLRAVASAHGLSAADAVNRFGFERATAAEELLADPSVGLVVVATRHASHAPLATAALRAGKAVFVEKPPSLAPAELAELRRAEAETDLALAVGFNRRHAPLSQELRRHVREAGGPIDILVRVNASRLADDHWLNDLEDGGGRLVGEGCHFVDLACWIVGAAPSLVTAHVHAEPDAPIAAAQSFTVGLDFPDGSVASILYSARGATGLAKEYVEAHAGGRSAILDDFRTLELRRGNARRRRRGRGIDKGHVEQFRYLRLVLAGEAQPEEPSPLATMAATFAALRSATTGAAVKPDEVL